MSESTTITLIGSKLAKVGTEFIFRGAVGECEKCKLKNTCINLDRNKKYRVVALRNGMEHDCYLHDTSVKAVEVVPCPIIAMIESRKAFNGSRIIYEEPECEDSCPHYEICHPTGLVSGDKYTIAEVLGDDHITCPKGLTLKKVELRV
ncbi:hypothetical protein CUJ83_02810 [Methanocella sp. CWC-04]|uniref:UPF0179 protein CUJ83_02810 n=1 Tax=Methanooceanicella nereidis TaxID=2052831 RepID=A0AAP2RAS7_9EURY|nr:UPF0179 family protein [Methanocella sp. CWC-04]MCD1293928.1 hypothetical protein [Methanocella sp. CWC-04]